MGNVKNKIVSISKYFISMVPRNKNIWVFGGYKGLRFADNSRYMFIYSSRHTNKKCVWLSQDSTIVQEIRRMGYTAYLSNEPLGLYYGFRAKWHIYDNVPADISRYSSIGAHWFNLWHGIPIRNINGIATNPSGKVDKKHFLSFANRDIESTILKIFEIDKDNFIISNQPRNIVFNINDKEKEYYTRNVEKEILNDIKIKKNQGSKILGYFPTWRFSGAENFMGVDNIEQLDDLNDILVKNNTYLLVKRHSCSFKVYKHHGYSERSEKNENALDRFSNIITMGFDIDLNSVLTECDMLISDYSSVIIDYLLADKPIILYLYDLKQYQKNPGLYYDYDKFKFGHQALSMQELVQTLKVYFEDEVFFIDQFRKNRHNLKDSFFASDECFNPILEILEHTN